MAARRCIECESWRNIYQHIVSKPIRGFGRVLLACSRGFVREQLNDQSPGRVIANADIQEASGPTDGHREANWMLCRASDWLIIVLVIAARLWSWDRRGRLTADTYQQYDLRGQLFTIASLVHDLEYRFAFVCHTKLSELAQFSMPSTHNSEKPWDTDDIDKWKVCKDQVAVLHKTLILCSDRQIYTGR